MDRTTTKDRIAQTLLDAIAEVEGAIAALEREGDMTHAFDQLARAAARLMILASADGEPACGPESA